MPKDAGDSDLLEDAESDAIPSDLDLDDEDKDVNLDAISDSNEADTLDDDHIENSDGFSFAESSDNGDLVDLDDDIPEGLIDYDGSDANNSPDEEEWAGFGGQKRKLDGDQKDHSRRKKLRSLPTFASYEDYAKMINDGPEDDI